MQSSPYDLQKYANTQEHPSRARVQKIEHPHGIHKEFHAWLIRFQVIVNETLHEIIQQFHVMELLLLIIPKFVQQ